ncbi:MAG: ABC transporter substrate-binding protein [Sciscionella sp.]
MKATDTGRTGWKRRTKRVIASLGACIVAASVVAACGSSNSSGGNANGNNGGKQLSWTHGILTPKADSGYQLMAEDKGYYKQEGVNVDLKHFTGNLQVSQAVISGAIDSADTAPAPAFKAVLKGANLKIIGSTLPKNTYAVLAQKSIKNWSDLKGKAIAVSAPGSFPDSVVKAILAKEGVDPNSITTVTTGSDSGRFKALTAGRVAAAAVSEQYVPKAKNNPKIHVLGEAQNIIPEYPRFYIVANGDALKKHPEAAVRFLAGEMRGVCYAVMHPKAEQKVAAKYTKISPTDPGVIYDQQAIAKAHAASPTSAITMSRLEFANNFLVKEGLQQKKVDLNKIVDNSYRQKALKLANLPKQCLNDPNANP